MLGFPSLVRRTPGVTFFAVVLVVAGCSTPQGHAQAPTTTVTKTVPPVVASVPAVTDSTTQELFARVMDTAAGAAFAGEDMGAIMQRVGELFVGSSYVGGLLDAPSDESLIVSLDKFDCVLFVETVLSLAQGIAHEDRSFDSFVGRVESLRYRDGRLDGYCSRLHYFSEWIHDNEKRGSVHNVTLALGGLRADGQLDFMSRNRDLYARFAGDDSLFAGVKAMEETLASLDRWYIPQNKIRSIYPLLRAGDIVATSTTVEGLDVSHSGLVYIQEDGGVGFLHASTKSGVTIAEDLAEYVLANRATHGIVVARPVDQRLSYD